MNTKKQIYAKADFESIRLKQGLSLRDIAKKTGLTPGVLSKMEHGRAIMPRSAGKICKALGCDFDSLFDLRG